MGLKIKTCRPLLSTVTKSIRMGAPKARKHRTRLLRQLRAMHIPRIDPRKLTHDFSRYVQSKVKPTSLIFINQYCIIILYSIRIRRWMVVHCSQLHNFVSNGEYDSGTATPNMGATPPSSFAVGSPLP